jgi:hypothetical protein
MSTLAQKLLLMKHFLLFSLMFGMLMVLNAKAQNNVGIGTTTPNASALLDLTATDKGFLMTRVTLLAAANGASPINTPATGLLVYNTGGALSAGFYYWNGTMWVQVGASAAPTCVTLDEAYDCGGNGVGRSITVDNGRIEMTMPVGATNDEGLYIVSNKGTSVAPTAVAWLVQNQWGVGLQVENNLGANQFSAIQGVSYTSQTTTTTFPAGVAGYCSGTGKGAGVWAEYDGTNTGGAGLYAKSSGNNFGARMHGVSYPGGYITTASASSVALQVASGSTSNINPAALFVGSAQFDISNASATSVLMNNLAAEPTIAPLAGGWGYLGTNTVYWYYLYYQNATAVSKREYKRDIQPLDNNLYSFVMEDIMKMKPSLYKFKNESDSFIEGNGTKTRYNFHLGLILDEAPDYLQDNAFSGIDVYALSTLTLAGVQYLNNEIQVIKSQVAISDFGTGSILKNEVRIEYSATFASANMESTPVVMITPSSPGAKYYIKSQDKTGFVLVSENGPMTFNWSAMGQKTIETPTYSLPEQTISQLRIDNSKKQQMRSFCGSPQQQPMQLIEGNNASSTKSLRIAQ